MLSRRVAERNQNMPEGRLSSILSCLPFVLCLPRCISARTVVRERPSSTERLFGVFRGDILEEKQVRREENAPDLLSSRAVFATPTDMGYPVGSLRLSEESTHPIRPEGRRMDIFSLSVPADDWNTIIDDWLNPRQLLCECILVSQTRVRAPSGRNQ